MPCWLLLLLSLLLLLLLLVSLLQMPLLLWLLSLSLPLLMWLTWAVVKHHTVPYSMCDIVQHQTQVFAGKSKIHECILKY